MQKGKFKWFDSNKGYGFIEADDINDINYDKGAKILYKGDKETVEVGSGRKGSMTFNVIPESITERGKNST